MPFCLPAFYVELELFTTVTKTSTSTCMTFSLNFGDKGSSFHAVKKITQWDVIKPLVLHISKCIDPMFQNMQTAWNQFMML